MSNRTHKDDITADGPSFKTTSATNPVVHVKGVDVRNDDKEPFENDTKLFECKNMVDIKVWSDAHKVVLKPDGPCFKSTSTNNSPLDVKDANVNKVKTMHIVEQNLQTYCWHEKDILRLPVPLWENSKKEEQRLLVFPRTYIDCVIKAFILNFFDICLSEVVINLGFLVQSLYRIK